MKYDIPTLLALSQNARQEIEKYRAQALGRTCFVLYPLSQWSVLFTCANGYLYPGNLVRQRKGNSSALSERSANRSREASNLSYHSEVTSVSGPSLRLPSRQPNNPPRGNLAQTDSGFARFLKEHSSPKHQRVTAGGRIIPMDPSTPAPKMKLPVKKADPKSCDGAANTIPHGEHHNKTQRKPTQSMEKEVNTSDNVKSSSLPAGVLVDQTKLFGGNGALGQYIQAQGVFSNLPSASMAPTMLLRPGVTLPLGNPVLQPEQQTQEYLKLLQNCAAYGVGDQFAWLPNTSQPMNLQNPTASFMPGSGQPHASVSGPSTEFSTCNSFVPMAPSVISSLSPGLDSFYSTFGATGVPFVGSQAPLLNQALPFQGATQGGVDVASVQGAAREYEVLSAQLSRLDRYMALHTWDLDPRSKKLLVEERMELVRDLDTMRLYKEQLESVFAQAKSGSAESEKRSNIRSPAGQLPLGDFTSNQTAQMARFSAPNTSNVPATLSGPTLTAGFQQMSMNDPFHATLQWPSKGNLYSLDTGLGLGDLPANSELYETDASYYDEGSSKAPGPDKQDVQFPATESTDAERSCCDGWATPTKSVPTDISRIYRRVEEATKRGVPIDSLLQELAAVTTRLVRQVSEERNVSHLALNPGGKMAVNSNGPVSSAAAPSRHVLHAQPRSHAIGRLWRSEGLAQASANSPGNTPYETDEEDGAESCSSSSSTTNSWATIQEGE